MRIFVSHAISDQVLIKKILETLKPYGLELLVSEHYIDIEKNITTKIETMIKQCDVALILLTKDGFNSHFVQQEIGYIKSQRRPFLQLVEIGMQEKIKGFNFGYDYILLNPNEPQIAVEKIKYVLLNYWDRLRQRQQIKLKRIEEQRRRDNQTKLGLGILAGLIIIGLLGGDD